KSTLGRTLLRLVEATSGSITFEGTDVTRLKRSGLKAARRDMQIIFQDSVGSLDPRMRVRDLVGEGLSIHGISRNERAHRVADTLERVGLGTETMRRHSHQFRRGQRPRIGIARALVLRPKLVVADEPVSALDVSVGAQVLLLLQELQREFRLTYVFISHSLPVVAQMATRIAVMRAGKLVESGDAEQVLCR